MEDEDVLVYEDGDVVVDAEESEPVPLDDDDDDDDDDGDDDGAADGKDDVDDALRGSGIRMVELPVDDSLAVFTEHEEPVYCVAASPDGTMVATGDGNDLAFLWRPETGEAVAKLSGHTDTVVDVAFNHDGTRLATAGLDAVVKVWDAASGDLLRTLEGPGEDLEWVCWHPRGNIVAAGSADFTSWMWDAGSGKCLQVFAGHEGRVVCGRFTPNGRRLLTAGGDDDGSVRLWDPKTGLCEATFSGHGWHERGTGVTRFALASDKPLVLTAGLDGTARLANYKTKKIIGTLVHAAPVAVTPPSTAAGGDGSADDGGEPAGAAAGDAAESAGGGDAVAASTTAAGAGASAGAGAGAGAGAVDGDDGYGGVDEEDSGLAFVSVEGVGFSATHPWVATGGSDGVVKVWELATLGTRVVMSQGEGRGVVGLQWHPSRATIVTISAAGPVYVWDALAGVRTALLTGHPECLMDLVLTQLPGAGAAWAAVVGGDDAAARVFLLGEPAPVVAATAPPPPEADGDASDAPAAAAGGGDSASS